MRDGARTSKKSIVVYFLPLKSFVLSKTERSSIKMTLQFNFYLFIVSEGGVTKVYNIFFISF